MPSASTSQQQVPPDLDAKYSQLKRELVRDEDIEAVTDSWKRLLVALKKEASDIAKKGPSSVPTVAWDEIKENNFTLTADQSKRFKETGAMMVKGVIDRPQIDKWFNELVDFVETNSGSSIQNSVSMYNLFWTKPQTEARFHPNLVKLFKIFGNQFFVEDEDNSLIDLDTQVVYGDRIRIRQPGASATLPLHVDSSSIERWEDLKFRETYKEIFEGKWEDWDPWKLDSKQYAQEDLYEHLGDKRNLGSICSSFRTLQGWLGLSDNKTGEGTLRLLPNVRLAAAYIILRPLFWNDPESGNLDDYQIDLETPKFPGVTPGSGAIGLHQHYPHLYPLESVVGIPNVEKGDFVFWHTDLPHEVDPDHTGDGHSSVFYYAVTPLTVTNIGTLLDSRDAWKRNVSPKDYRSQYAADFKEFQGADTANLYNDDSKRSMGLLPFDTKSEELTKSQRRVREIANAALEKGEFDVESFLQKNNIIPS